MEPAKPASVRLRRVGQALFPPLLLAGCNSSPHLTFLGPQGPIAAAERTHFIIVGLMMLIVVVPVLLLTPFVAWRYRYGNRSSPYAPKWSFNWPLEIAIWGVPFGVVTALAVWLAQDTTGLDPYKPLASASPPLRIDVIGYDWKWLFVYPDYRIASMGELALPAGRPLSFTLTSSTVLQSFFIPALGSQIYAMPGMVTRLHLEAKAPGSMRGENSQYNGQAFEEQKFIARAMTPADFDAWTRMVEAKGVPMTPETYQAVRARNTVDDLRGAKFRAAAESMPLGALYFRDVSPGLLEDVVQSFHGGKPAATSFIGRPAALPQSE